MNSDPFTARQLVYAGLGLAIIQVLLTVWPKVGGWLLILMVIALLGTAHKNGVV